VRPHAASLDAALQGAPSARQLLDRLEAADLGIRLPDPLGVDELLVLADHEAGLREHPQLAGDHVVLAAARICGDDDAYRRLAAQLDVPPPRRRRFGWRPRGRRPQ
jgi:hypothetical protein